MSPFQYVPAHNEAFYQHCMEKDDSSTVVSSTSSKPFSSRFYSATGFRPPPAAAFTPPPLTTMPPRYNLRRRRERPAQSEPELSKPPRKRARKMPNQKSRPPIRSRPTQPRRPPPASTTNSIRLRLAQPRPPPPKPRTPSAEPAPAPTRTPNFGMPPSQRTPKVYIFRLPGGHGTHGTNNPHQAQLLRERFRCASWLLGDIAPTTGGAEIGTGFVEQDRSWEWNVFQWTVELRPVDSVTERGDYDGDEE